MTPSDQRQPLWVQRENEELKTIKAFSTTFQLWHFIRPQLRVSRGRWVFPHSSGGKKSPPHKALVSHTPVRACGRWGACEGPSPLPFATLKCKTKGVQKLPDTPLNHNLNTSFRSSPHN